MKAYKPILNWCWILEYEINPDNTITILRHYRTKDEWPDQNDVTFSIHEDNQRTALDVFLNGKTYKVANPKFVFDYI